ncbi:PDZ domain-containing protein [Colwellia sp. MB3u-4]|uniref:PDZ domain-containing protein n=1 Tax=Colwellia sp. MB3u-4 TaxID=2759822 RepID=UPI0015F5C635|nr:PDZ domain-containing protein [Colwellia sp. MB3u-4]MBA6287858.1 PDZ domain-containing protein [Colwellia sp. MB3u-4]
MNSIRKILLISLFLPFAAFADGKIGIAAGVSVDGFFSPEITEFKIDKVHPGSPAEKAGVKVGQLVIELDGCKIPGCPADKAKKLMDKEIGEILPLLVKNLDGSKVLLKIHVGE